MVCMKPLHTLAAGVRKWFLDKAGHRVGLEHEGGHGDVKACGDTIQVEECCELESCAAR
jgi:hypothetical protein